MISLFIGCAVLLEVQFIKGRCGRIQGLNTLAKPCETSVVNRRHHRCTQWSRRYPNLLSFDVPQDDLGVTIGQERNDPELATDKLVVPPGPNDRLASRIRSGGSEIRRCGIGYVEANLCLNHDLRVDIFSCREPYT